MSMGQLRRRRAAFSLLELMVALTVGGIAITSMYAIGATTTRQFHQQHQLANTLTSLRMALNQIKRDIARAGYLSTPNATPGAPHLSPLCNVPAIHDPGLTGSLAAISRFDDDVCGSTSGCSNLRPGASTNNTSSGFSSDELRLLANYETASEYSGLQYINATSVAIARTTHPYETDFTQWYAGSTAFDAPAFNRAFTVGRMVRIRTTSGLYHFATITSVTPESAANDAVVSFTGDPLPTVCQTTTEGGWIAPVSFIRYFPRNEPNPDPNEAQSWGPMAQLVRQEVQPGDKATGLGSPARVVLDYLVNFNLGFVAKGADAVVGAADSYTPGNDTTSAAVVNANPERVRAVTIELSARTPEQDRSLAWSAAACANLSCYQVFTDRPGASRVRTLRAEVFLPNVAFESY